MVAESAAADALIVSHRASEATIAAERRHWYGTAGGAAAAGLAAAPAADRPARRGWPGSPGRRRWCGGTRRVRSVWFLNSLRGALALAAAVAVADLSGVQHGFWVVLGTLSVLRTSAASTGSTAWRALAGTVVGFVVGAALLVGIGTGAGRAVGGAAARGAGRRVRAGYDAVRRRPGGVHGDHRRAVQPARPGRLAGRAAAGRGRGDRLRRQPRGRRAVLAARRVRRWSATTSRTRSGPGRPT